MALIERFLSLLFVASCMIYFADCSEKPMAGQKYLQMPKLGVGFLDIKSDVERENVLMMALNAGYRMIDLWEGDEIPAEAAITRSKIPREKIFIIVKLMYPEKEEDVYNSEFAALDVLERLGTSYVDLVLINYPYNNNSHISVWKTLIRLKRQQKIRNIGVSNFNYEQIMLLKKQTGVLPAVVQLEINPFFQQSSLVKNLANLGIAIQAYSPLANGNKLNDTRLGKIAKAYDATTAQLMIQWCLQKNYSCITKSRNRNHLEDNIDLGEFHLEEFDMKELDSLDEGYVTNYDPNGLQGLQDTSSSIKDHEHHNIDEKTPKKLKGRMGDDLDETPKKPDENTEDNYSNKEDIDTSEQYDDDKDDEPMGPEYDDSMDHKPGSSKSATEQSYFDADETGGEAMAPSRVDSRLKGDYGKDRDEL